jgi:FkbM family methyltransferase
MSAIDKLFTLKDRAFLHARRISRSTATVEVAGRRLTFKTDTVAGTKAIKDSDEQPNIEWLANRATGTFWDIGANRGLFSAAVPRRTISFEPDIRLHPELINNVRRNNTDCITSSFALADTEDWIALEVNQNVGTNVITARSVQGDTLVDINRYASPLIIKFDIEGMELAVLKGLDKTLGNVDTVLLEAHSDNLFHECMSFLQERGLKTEEYTIPGRDGTPYIRAVRK